MEHLDNRSDFRTDEEFANFRALILANKKSKNFYRSASSTINRYGRLTTVQKIMQKNNIKTVIDLSDLRCQCQSEQFGYMVVALLRKAQQKPAPYIIQCEAGKKRTGFVCIILEALSGTSRNLIIEDYLVSYKNNNRLDTTRNPALAAQTIQQDIIPRIDYIMSYNQDTTDNSLQEAAINYLLYYGMPQKEIANLQALLK